MLSYMGRSSVRIHSSLSSRFSVRYSKYCLVPQRYIFVIFATLGIFISTTIRHVLTRSMRDVGRFQNNTECVVPKVLNTTIRESQSRFNWTERTKAVITSSFYAGYFLTHIPAGALSEQYGGKHVVGFGMLIQSICTLFLPRLLNITDGNQVTMMFVRVMEGLASGTSYPGIASMMGQWIPSGSVTLLGCIIFSGNPGAVVFVESVTGRLIRSTGNFAVPSYLYGSLGVLWWVLWVVFCYSAPSSHPCLSFGEQKRLTDEIDNVRAFKRHIPWTQILSSKAVWAIIIRSFGHSYAVLSLVNHVPQYYRDIFHVNQTDKPAPHLVLVPFATMFLMNIVGGLLCDLLVRRCHLKLTLARKLFSSVSSIGAGIFLMGASYSGCNRTLCLVCFTLMLGCFGCFYCTKVNALDLSPSYAGTLMGLLNGIGALGGIVSPIIARQMVKHDTLEEWRNVFWLCFVVLNLSNIVYVICGSAEEQWWNDAENFDTPSTSETSSSEFDEE